MLLEHALDAPFVFKMQILVFPVGLALSAMGIHEYPVGQVWPKQRMVQYPEAPPIPRHKTDRQSLPALHPEPNGFVPPPVLGTQAAITWFCASLTPAQT